MPDQSEPAGTKDARVDAAFRDYLERLDRGETVDRQEFLSRHAEIADALRSLIDADELLKKQGAQASRRVASASTRSFAAQGQETVPPNPTLDRPSATGGGLSGRFGRYEIIRAIGSGAMGAVYLAIDTQLKRNVAIKTPHFENDPTGELLRRFYREAEAAATLRHANICPVHDVGEIDGKHYISMAYIEGRPLSDLIKSDKPPSGRQIVLAVHKLAKALQEAHDHGIVHRDLKPANIMVDKKGEPVIMDFGLARRTPTEGEATLTRSGAILGSPAYMSPEQIEGDPDRVGPASDQYSLGVVLYEGLTGQLPFRGPVMNVLAQIINKSPSPPSELRPGLDPRLEAVCLRMMAKKAADRFSSMNAVADQLAAIVKNPAIAPIVAEKPPTEGPPVAAAASPGDSGASQARKATQLKASNESDLKSAEDLARKRLRSRDYDQMIEIIERIPEKRRNDALKTLVVMARKKVDQIAALTSEVDEADELGDGQTALKKADELLKIKPGQRRAREIQAKYSTFRKENEDRIGQEGRVVPRSSAAAWILAAALALAVAVFAGIYGMRAFYSARTALVVDVKTPGVEVAVKGAGLTITGPNKQSLNVEPGEQELKIKSSGFETTTKSFLLKKGETKTVTVSVAGTQFVARLEDEILATSPIHDQRVPNPTDFPKGAAANRPANPKPADAALGQLANADRKAATWVLSIGGTIKISERGRQREVKAEGELPKGAFDLTAINLGGNTQATGPGLALFKDCKSVESLGLSGTRVGDPGLAYFANCKNLTNLLLDGTLVSDVSLERLAGFRKLVSVFVKRTNVTDVGVKKLAAALPQCKIEWEADASVPKAPAAAASQPEFVPLFNGKDLSGWTAVENGGSWSVDTQRVLIGQASEEVGKPLILIANQGDYKDFELAIQILNAEPSALQAVIRRSAVGNHYSGYGIAATDTRVGTRRVIRRGSIYRAASLTATSSHNWDASAKESQVGAGEWCTLKITAIGNHIKSTIDDAVVADFEDQKSPFEAGGIALILHSGKTVHIKEIKIWKLTP